MIDAFHRFADSPLWALQRQYFEVRGPLAWGEGQVPHHVTTSPATAYAYAAVILAYLRDAARTGALDASAPVYVFELGAGCGRLAHHLVTELSPMLEAWAPELPVRYVMTDLAAANVASWMARPKLRRRVEERRLDVARFDVERDEALRLEQAGETIGPGSLRNAPIVVANYVFDSIPQDLFFVEGGELREGWIALHREDGAPIGGVPAHPFRGVRMRYEARASERPLLSDPRWTALLEQRMRGGARGPLLFPTRALQALARLRKMHAGRGMLLLAADRAGDDRPAAGLDAPGLAIHGSLSQPVDFELLGASLRLDGAQTWLGDRPGGLTVLAAAVGPGDAPRETAHAAREHLSERSPSDFHTLEAALKASRERLNAARALAVLRVGRWDERLFVAALPLLRRTIADASASVQRSWSAALDAVAERHLPIGEASDLAFDLGTVAARMAFWAQAAHFFEASLASHGPHAATLHNLGSAWWQLARHDEAEHALALAVERDPERPLHAEQLQALRATREACQALLGADRLDAARMGEAPALAATLLALHHAAALHRHQSDADVARGARVEQLTSVPHARAWIAGQRREARQTTLALIDPTRGLIGAVGVRSTGAVATFYYWIAAEHRRRRLGHRAVELACAFAFRRGARRLSSPVHRGNAASRRVLERAGFVAGGADPDDPDMLSYELDLAGTGTKSC